MSIDELGRKQEELQAQMEDLKARAQEWRERGRAAEEAVEEGAVAGESTREAAITAHEAKLAEKALGKKYGDLEERLEGVRKELAREQYRRSYQELVDMRQRIFEEMADSNAKVVETVHEEFDRQLGLVANYNPKAASLNRLARRLGLPEVKQITRLAHYDAAEFARVLMRTELVDGMDGVREPITPLPTPGLTRRANVPVSSNREGNK